MDQMEMVFCKKCGYPWTTYEENEVERCYSIGWICPKCIAGDNYPYGFLKELKDTINLIHRYYRKRRVLSEEQKKEILENPKILDISFIKSKNVTEEIVEKLRKSSTKKILTDPFAVYWIPHIPHLIFNFVSVDERINRFPYIDFSKRIESLARHKILESKGNKIEKVYSILIQDLPSWEDDLEPIYFTDNPQKTIRYSHWSLLLERSKRQYEKLFVKLLNQIVVSGEKK